MGEKEENFNLSLSLDSAASSHLQQEGPERRFSIREIRLCSGMIRYWAGAMIDLRGVGHLAVEGLMLLDLEAFLSCTSWRDFNYFSDLEIHARTRQGGKVTCQGLILC
jgi:hypothetical protein